jgi:hypothetical protein
MVGHLIGIEENCWEKDKLMEDVTVELIICLSEVANDGDGDSDYEDCDTEHSCNAIACDSDTEDGEIKGNVFEID